MHTLHYNLHICFSSLGPRRERFLFLICRVALMSELRFLPALLCFHNYEFISRPHPGFSVVVSPFSAFAQSCLSFGTGLSLAGAGYPASFSISSFDMFGNKVTKGGESFLATLQVSSNIVSASVQDKLDGSYDVFLHDYGHRNQFSSFESGSWSA